MATGEIKLSALPIKPTPDGADSIPLTDISDSNATRKTNIEDLASALDYSQSLSTDVDNLIVQGSDLKLRLEANADVISSDVGNILQKGTDGKLLAPSVAASLTENRMWIGGATNTPEEKTDLEVRSFLGLSTDYIKHDIQYVSSNQVSWEGKCRDSSDSRDFIISSPLTASLISPTSDTIYYLFVASNTLTDTPVVVWDTAQIPAGYTYYRLVFKTKTNSIGNIINFKHYKQGDNRNKIIFKSVSSATYFGEQFFTTGSDVNTSVTTNLPSNVTGIFNIGTGSSGEGRARIINTDTFMAVQMNKVSEFSNAVNFSGLEVDVDNSGEVNIFTEQSGMQSSFYAQGYYYNT